MQPLQMRNRAAQFGMLPSRLISQVCWHPSIHKTPSRSILPMTAVMIKFRKTIHGIQTVVRKAA
jgi:hypothetical protein